VARVIEVRQVPREARVQQVSSAQQGQPVERVRQALPVQRVVLEVLDPQAELAVLAQREARVQPDN